MTTARDVAEAIGVSVSTVGRALADDPRISRATKEKVKREAARIGYVSNMPARIVRGGSSNLIGLILPDVRNDFYAAIAQALSETCDRENFRLVLSIAGDDRETEARHIRELASARAAGIIIVPSASPKRESLQMLKAMKHVQLLRYVDAIGGAGFGIDDGPAIRKSTEHLIALGHRRIAYIGGHEKLSTGASRVAGFRDAMAAGGAQLQKRELLGPPTIDFGKSALDALLASEDPPSAILTGSVHITLGLVKRIEQLGIDVPGNLSLVGFGDPEWFEWWHGGMTTVKPPIDELATTCGLWFLHQLSSDGAGADVEHRATTASRFIDRATTAPLSREEA